VSSNKIGVIGAGKIGAAMARGVIRGGLASKENVMASDVSDALRESIVQDLGIKATPDNTEVCSFADVVILAVKPQIVDPVARQIAKKLGKTKLLVSVAAGVPLRRLETQLEPGARVVRVMPNICCVVGAGAAGYASGAHATGTGHGKSQRDSQQLRNRYAHGGKISRRGHRPEWERTCVCLYVYGSSGRRRRSSRFCRAKWPCDWRYKLSMARRAWRSSIKNI
jgi:glycerol-3-phosphate dehydrogenase